MNFLDILTKEHVLKKTLKTPGSVRIGQTIQTVEEQSNWQEELRSSAAEYVIIGLPEEIGLKSSGIKLTNIGTFSSFIEQFVNLQDNLYLSGVDLFLLGSIEFEDLANKLKVLKTNQEDLYELVEVIDKRVEKLLSVLFEMGKTPIVIGGGQNNSYPILKALSKQKNEKVNCLNIAAHTSLQPPNGRSARNAYSYGIVEDYIGKYYAFGLHESEIPHTIYEFILANYSQVGFTRFEAILKNDPYMFEALDEATEFLEGAPAAIDVNMNCIADLVLSPQYPDGFLLREVRQLIRKFCATNKQVHYLHLCEASSAHKEYTSELITGKSLALLVADFIKASNYTEHSEE